MIPFWQGGLNLRLVALVVSIQPFAYVVANYTCHDRNNESNKYIHRKVRAPSLCRYRGGNKINYSIIYFKSNQNDKNFTCINAIFVVKYILLFGVWLSLVERFVRDEEAVGSNPVTPI